MTRSRFTLIIAILFIVNFASCIAYSAVAIIVPGQVLGKGLSSFYAGLIIAGYPFSQMLTGGIINSLMNNRGKKRTLIIGTICLGLGLLAFGNAAYLSKWPFFFVCLICRLFIGFGSAAIGTSSSSIIAVNFPEKMAMLINILNIVNSVAFILGPNIGAIVLRLINYEWVFNLNSILVLGMMVLAQIFYPYDPPLVESENLAKSTTLDDDQVSLKEVATTYGCFSVAGCVVCSMYCFAGKEPIL